jgi:large subunit ribosomal protein L24
VAKANLGRRTKASEMTGVHVRKNDTVVVLAGKDKDKKGKVLQVFAQDGKVLIDGINVARRHTKPRPGQTQGGILEKSLPLNASKVQLVCSKCSKPTRIGKKAVQQGDRTSYVRVCKHCNEEI